MLYLLQKVKKLLGIDVCDKNKLDLVDLWWLRRVASVRLRKAHVKLHVELQKWTSRFFWKKEVDRKSVV